MTDEGSRTPVLPVTHGPLPRELSASVPSTIVPTVAAFAVHSCGLLAQLQPVGHRPVDEVRPAERFSVEDCCCSDHCQKTSF